MNETTFWSERRLYASTSFENLYRSVVSEHEIPHGKVSLTQ